MRVFFGKELRDPIIKAFEAIKDYLDSIFDIRINTKTEYDAKHGTAKLRKHTLYGITDVPIRQHDTITIYGAIETAYMNGEELQSGIMDEQLVFNKATYKRVEYLKSTGTQYVVTDMISNYDMKFVIDLQIGDRISSGGYVPWFLFGYYSNDRSSASHTVTLNDNPAASDVYIGWNYEAHSVYGNVFHFYSAPYSTRNILTVSRAECTWGSAVDDIDNVPLFMPRPANKFPIFGFYNGSGYQAQENYEVYLYEFKVYEGNTLTHDFVPVEDQGTYELGLYDTVTNVFYGNAGTGDFIKGPYVEE